jgi:uncharacterized protein
MIASQCVPFVLHESHTLNVLQSRLHGLDHWWRVWKNAQLLTNHDTPADLEVVGLYALFHDSMRLNDGEDYGHGLRGYKLWERIYSRTGLEEYLSMKQRELLFEACAEHSEGRRSTDSTVAVCWDADRLDLHRKGIWPDVRLLSTPAAIDLTMMRIKS